MHARRQIAVAAVLLLIPASRAFAQPSLPYGIPEEQRQLLVEARELMTLADDRCNVVSLDPEPPVQSDARGADDSGCGAKSVGEASWYGPGFHGRLTAAGERFDTHDFTAAHPTLPLGSIVRVTNLENNRFVDVRINDRGPYVHGRIIDLSYSAAEQIDLVENGTAPVKLECLRRREESPTYYVRLILPETEAAVADLLAALYEWRNYGSSVVWDGTTAKRAWLGPFYRRGRAAYLRKRLERKGFRAHLFCR